MSAVAAHYRPDETRIVAALAGPLKEVLLTIVLQPTGGRTRRDIAIPVPRPHLCPTCGQRRPEFAA